MAYRPWAEQEDAILRAVVAKHLSEVDAQAELARWGWHRSLEAAAQRLRVIRARVNREAEDSDDMLRYSISRRWL